MLLLFSLCWRHNFVPDGSYKQISCSNYVTNLRHAMSVLLLQLRCTSDYKVSPDLLANVVNKIAIPSWIVIVGGGCQSVNSRPDRIATEPHDGLSLVPNSRAMALILAPAFGLFKRCLPLFWLSAGGNGSLPAAPSPCRGQVRAFNQQIIFKLSQPGNDLHGHLSGRAGRLRHPARGGQPREYRCPAALPVFTCTSVRHGPRRSSLVTISIIIFHAIK